jgi:hypothetical protein
MYQTLLDIIHAIYALLKDQSWGGIGTLIGVAVVLFERKRETATKTIAHVIVKHDSHSHPRHGPLHYVLWKIWNCGTEPILQTDYDHPIIFIFGNNATMIHEARIYKTEPANRKNISITTSGNSAELIPILLNDRESITLEFLVTPIKDLNINLRIAGKTIDMAQRRKKKFQMAIIFRNLLLFLLLPWLISLIAHIHYPQFSALYYLSIGFVFLIFLLATLSIIYQISALLWI